MHGPRGCCTTQHSLTYCPGTTPPATPSTAADCMGKTMSCSSRQLHHLEVRPAGDAWQPRHATRSHAAQQQRHPLAPTAANAKGTTCGGGQLPRAAHYTPGDDTWSQANRWWGVCCRSVAARRSQARSGGRKGRLILSILSTSCLLPPEARWRMKGGRWPRPLRPLGSRRGWAAAKKSCCC
jgi:hypothetical protein